MSIEAAPDSETPPPERAKYGKQQKVAATASPALSIVTKANKTWAGSEDDVVATGSSSPISASLKRARVRLGNDDSMATVMDDLGVASSASWESSDDDPHLG
ncbi:hypothetical protein BC827DRAFT_1271956 [Russula dissimulans]|nr:hypothetical protein BC827DRAFT_1271956 [Russula dissimulans]